MDIVPNAQEAILSRGNGEYDEIMKASIQTSDQEHSHQNLVKYLKRNIQIHSAWHKRKVHLICVGSEKPHKAIQKISNNDSLKELAVS